MTNPRNTPLLLGLGLCGIALLLMTALSLRAAPADRKGGIAVVDTAALTQKLKSFKEEDERFKLFREEKERVLQIRLLLNTAEWDELDALDAKKNLKPDESKRREELRSLSERRHQLRRELESKVNSTEQDREELEKLRRIPKSNQVRLEDLAKALETQVREELQRLEQKLRTTVTGVYDRVGKSHGFSVVLDKNDVQWSDQTIDITDEVAKQMNGR